MNVGGLPERLLVGLVGRAGAGKTTVADYLESEHAFCHLALAEPIAGMLSALFELAHVPSTWMTDRRLKESATALGYSYRQLAQSLGTEWAREQLTPDFWLRVATPRLRAARQQGHPVVVSDVRYPNEAAWIVQHGGVLVLLDRAWRPDEPVINAHTSEAHWRDMPVAHTFHNHGSRVTLFDQVDAWLDTMRVPAATATTISKANA